ncbi:probable G-protein coupled receptor Mth-like 4 [Hetaerina americana]|uniref:probable G-protein coupled receptor Mth-like 4 n=1 Tax=Hetaerina americana TaxID=62018 RepID=UPI003A7F1179
MRVGKVALVVLTVAFGARASISKAPLDPMRRPVARDRPPCELEFSFGLQSPEVFANGSLWDHQRRELYPPGTYWKWDSSSKDDFYLGCPCNLGRPCLRKCCHLGMVFNEDQGCVPSPREDEEFRVSVSSDDGTENHRVLASENFYLIFGNTCHSGYYRLRPETYEDNAYFVRASNGSLAMPKAQVASLWKDEFCVDHDVGVGEVRPYLCLPLFKRMSTGIPSIQFPTFLLVTAPVVCCTFLAYVFLKEARQTLDSKLRMFLLFNVFYAFLLEACVMIYAGEIKEFQTLTLAIGSQFFALAVGCWITVMLFCLSRSSWATTSDDSGEKKAKKLVCYCVYSWGIPLLATLLAAVKLKGEVLPYNEVNPGYAQDRAWIGIFQNSLLFFFGADAAVLLLNLALLAISTMKLHQFNKEISVLGDQSVFSKHRKGLWNHKKRFMMAFLLLLIDCIFRSVEAAFWMVALPEPGLQVVDIVDSISGVAICALLVIGDGIYVLLKREMLLFRSSWFSHGREAKENEPRPKKVEGIQI